MTLTSGSLFSERYKIIRVIGSGGASTVYEAFDEINKVNVAIKLFKNKVTESEFCYKDFVNESMIVSSLNNNNIVSLYNCGMVESYPFLVMELINENSLKEVLDKRSYLTIDESIDIMLQLLSALKCAHNHKCIHKDIKPHNIYLKSDGTIKLGDFGISEITENSNEGAKRVIGTVQYCAPEIFKGEKSSISSDIYSCGVVFYELLVGKVPFDEDSVKATALAHINNQFPSLKNVPKNLQKIIFKCVEKNPKKRYKNCEEFYDKLFEFKIKFNKEKK